MRFVWFLPVLLLLHLGPVPYGYGKNVSSRPAVVNIGAIFTMDSTIGRVAKIAIREAVKDVNSNTGILPGTKLVVSFQNSNCSGFIGMVEGTPASPCLVIFTFVLCLDFIMVFLM